MRDLGSLLSNKVYGTHTFTTKCFTLSQSTRHALCTSESGQKNKQRKGFHLA